MGLLTNHGCLIVDSTDRDTATNDKSKMSKIWETTAKFFNKVANNKSPANILPSIQPLERVSSPHAVVGFASFRKGDNQFIEIFLR